MANVAGGIVQGRVRSSLLNNGGLVYANGSSTLAITSLTANVNGGELHIGNNAALTIVNSFTNGA